MAVEIVVQARGTVSRVDLVGAVLPAAVWLGQGLLGKATMEVMQAVLGQILALEAVVVQDKLVKQELILHQGVEMVEMVLHLLFLGHLLLMLAVAAGAHRIQEMLA